jgi:Mg-chelatase subunit ChlD
MLDTSGSMGLPPDAAMNELTDRVGQGDWLAILEFKRLLFQTPRHLSRLGIAVTALESLVDALPPERELGLVTSGRCEGPRQVGVFDAGHRQALKQLADSIQPEEGTPLAAGLAAAGAMLEGEPTPLLVVITDGAETCGGDPCAEAQALQSRMPGLRINVVDLSGSNVAACLAQTTGGRVFAPDQAVEITADIGEAARTEQACSP